MTTLRERWIEALENETYERTPYTFKTGEGKFCAVGVALDLYDPDGWIDAGTFSIKDIDDSIICDTTAYDHPAIPKYKADDAPILKALGMTEYQWTRVMTLNMRYSFPVVARFIREMETT